MTPEEVSVSVAINSDVALECDVLESNPAPQIRWLQDGYPIAENRSDSEVHFLDDGRYLYLRSLTVADLASTYRCEVTNVFLDRPVMSPTIYRLIDNLNRGVLMDYKQIGDLTAFVGNISFEFAYVGGIYGNGVKNGTTNVLFQDSKYIPQMGNIAVIPTVEFEASTVSVFSLLAIVTYDDNSILRSGTLTVHRKF